MIGSVAVTLGIRPSVLLRAVEEEGILDLLFDAKIISEAMPKTGEEASLSMEIEQKYRRLGVSGWQQDKDDWR